MKIKTRIKRPPTRLFYSIFLISFLSIFFNSCNVTRTITTSSQYFQNGDTTTTIVTKTIESYDATRNIIN